MDERERAKHLLSFYFGMVARAAGVPWNADNDAEIVSIVDWSIDAAVRAAVQGHEDLLAERERLLAKNGILE